MDNPLVDDYLEARRERDRAVARYEEASARLIKQMEADQRKSFRWQADGHAQTLTYVQNRTTVVDEPGLRKALTAKVFDRYTKRVMDRKLMEAALDAGDVDYKVFAKYAQIKPSKPFLKYSTKDADE